MPVPSVAPEDGTAPGRTSKRAGTTSEEKQYDGFTAAERAAMKERAAELRAEGKKGAKKADGLRRSWTGSRP